jgi:hypothetical protein
MRGAPRPALAALLVAVATAAAPASARAQDRAAWEEGLVEIVAERLAPLTVIVLLDAAGQMLLPVNELVQYLGYTARFADGQLTLPNPAGTHTIIDERARLIITGADTVRLAPAELVSFDDGVYLRTERLALVLDGELTLDPATLSLVVTRRIPFPAQQRIVAEQRRAMLLAQRRAPTDARNDSVSYPAVSGGGVLDWELSTVGFDPASRTSARGRAGAALLGGDIVGGITLELGREAPQTTRDATLRYHRVFPHATAITQLRAGNIISSGIFARFVRGVEISNRPFLRDHELGNVLVRPDLPAGWEYEVFQGNQLLGYSEPGSRDAVSIPLRTGSTPVQVRMLGPAGEEVVSTLLYQTPVSMLRRGAFEYAAAAGRCEGATCAQFGHADARYGATSFLTLGGGFEHLADSLISSTRPYALASFTTGTRMTGELQLMPGALYSSNLAVFPRDRSTAHLRTSLSRPGFGPISLLPDELSRWDVELTWDERLQPGVSTFAGRTLPFGGVRIGAAAAGSALAGLERWRMAAAAGFSRGNAELRYDFERAALRPHTLAMRTALLTPVRLHDRTYRPMINGTVGIGQIGFRLAEVGASVQPRSNSVLHGAVQWSREARRPTFSLGWTARIGPVQGMIRGVAGRSGASSAAIISGSTAITHAGEVSTRATSRIGYAGLHGVVFVDHDGDGVFSPGDEPVPGAALVAGGVPVSADDQGRFHVWGLQPYGVIGLAVDSARIPDPSWTTVAPVILIRPAPNTARRVDVPLVQTRELLGSLTAGDRVATAGGVTLILTNLDSGDITTTLTFSDGQFYVSRIRPGRYSLTVAPSSLEVLGARARPERLEFTVPVVGDLVVELPPILLEAASGPPTN